MSYLGPSLRRARRRPSAGRRLLAAVVLSIALNLLVLSALDLSWIAAEPRREVNLAALSSEEWEQNRSVLDKLLGREKPRPQNVVRVGEAPEVEPKLPEPAKREPPRFLAERDSRVEKETRSKHAGLYDTYAPVPVLPAPGGARGRPDSRPDASQGRKARERRELALASPGELKLERPKDGLLADRGGAEEAPARGGVPGPTGAGGDGSPRRLDLRPSAGLMQQLTAGPATDVPHDVEEGEGTFLNTQQWRYAGFMNRMGDSVEPTWVRESVNALLARDPSLERYLYRSRETIVHIRLDSVGKLVEAKVVKSSGVEFLDHAVVKAWQDNQPFPNVPRGALNDRGEVAFLFSFTVHR